MLQILGSLLFFFFEMNEVGGYWQSTSTSTNERLSAQPSPLLHQPRQRLTHIFSHLNRELKLSTRPTLELSDDETAYPAGSMFGAGSDTTASAISVGVLVAACYLGAQAKVQEALDAVMGRERREFQCCDFNNS